MNNWLKMVALFLVVSVGPAFAFDGVWSGDPLFELQNRVFRVIDLQWRVNDLMAVAQPADGDKAYDAAVRQLQADNAELGRTVAHALEVKDRQVLEFVADVYGSLDAGARRALFPALQAARADGEAATIDRNAFSEYFPGYGYPEPGYKYRRGREIEREEKGATWQYEEHTISTSKSVKLTVSIDVLGILKSLLGLGKITRLVVGREYTSYYNGTPMIVVDVAFTAAETIFTKTNRKYDVSKVWFELLRSNDAGWHNSGTWEVVGKTFQIMMDPTGETITTEVQIPGGSSPTPLTAALVPDTVK